MTVTTHRRDNIPSTSAIDEGYDEFLRYLGGYHEFLGRLNSQSVLSPTAKPFQPVEFAIFNDGVPSSVYYGSHPEHEVLMHIEDDALDEKFPPSASDAAEIEAVEAFVDLMAWLSFLDEHEESARTSFKGFPKRWESRRAAGLIGKPHAVKNKALAVAIAKAAASHSGAVNVKETDLVPFVPKSYEATPAAQYKKGKGKFVQKANPKNTKGVHGFRNPIQQPRKHN